jgi:hypothetical protein
MGTRDDMAEAEWLEYRQRLWADWTVAGVLVAVPVLLFAFAALIVYVVIEIKDF